MRALDVVGKDLQLRLVLIARVVGEQYAVVGLLGVGLLRVLVDVDLAVEHAARLAVEDPLVQLEAVAVGLGVFE